MADETKETKKNGKEKAKGIVTEFKEFISKGNVLDMAVGLIIGSAFTAIVTSLVNDIFTPLIGLIIGGINFAGINITVGSASISIGLFLQAIINFLLTAVCVFIVVKTINSFRRKKEEKPAPPKPSKEELLLTEIRDLLKEQSRK
ncbi:MAG: large-conductance mechanosensitive channel protein MscL [Oscillospiraceae bacterium]|nr:large-conductance mechanosensitive channel protein MscL [Oscillospiraceae bacterium]